MKRQGFGNMVEHPAYRWDIDKTYLATDFATLRDLVKTALESAVMKVSIPGAASLLQCLRESGTEPPAPIYFVSASPPQMRAVIEKKMSIDGIRYDGISFKDQWPNIRNRRFEEMRKHIGYKVGALIAGRKELRADARESLFGDDSESDALSYCLYADLMAGRLAGVLARDALESLAVREEQITAILGGLDELARVEAVQSIFIYLASGDDPARFDVFKGRVTTIRNYFEAALVLFARGNIQASGVIKVGRSILKHNGFQREALETSLWDVRQRKLLPDRAYQILLPLLSREGLVNKNWADKHRVSLFRVLRETMQLISADESDEIADVPPLNYAAIAAAEDIQ